MALMCHYGYGTHLETMRKIDASHMEGNFSSFSYDSHLLSLLAIWCWVATTVVTCRLSVPDRDGTTRSKSQANILITYYNIALFPVTIFTIDHATRKFESVHSTLSNFMSIYMYVFQIRRSASMLLHNQSDFIEELRSHVVSGNKVGNL